MVVWLVDVCMFHTSYNIIEVKHKWVYVSRGLFLEFVFF